MNLENQVCSLDLAKRLKELGVKQESLWWWIDYEETEHYDLERNTDIANNALWNDEYSISYSAFTVAELGNLLQENFISTKHKTIWRCSDTIQGFTGYDANTEANARAKCFIHLLENKLIKVK